MNLVFAASECAPYAKTGGLGDVVHALPRELVRQGHNVSVFLPLYRSVATYLGKQQAPRRVKRPSVTMPFNYYNRFATILDGGKPDGVQMYFVDVPELYDRPGIYGDSNGDHRDNAERFGGFSRVVIEASKVLGVPDVFHVHDWQTSFLSILLRTTYFFDPVLRSVPSLLTIHNAGYQGWFAPKTIETLCLPWDIFNKDAVEQYDSFNALKGGVVYADAITAVSRRYAEEIKTPEFGAGLDPELRRRSHDLIGIVNGVDYDEWNPSTDRHIAHNYDVDNMAGKLECRRDLLKTFGLAHVRDSTPVFGIVSRFVAQKGFDIFTGAADAILAEDCALVVLGSGEDRIENMFRMLQRKYPNKVSCAITYDNSLAHKIEAGADIFVMPSHYEPCGLNQIYSLKYGTVPIVRATGGLDDTIDQWDPAANRGTGFKFYGTDSYNLLVAARWAMITFQNKPAWHTLQRNGMLQDFGWPKAAAQYVQVYEEIIRRRR